MCKKLSTLGLSELANGLFAASNIIFFRKHLTEIAYLGLVTKFVSFYCDDSVLDYEVLDVEVPTINIVGSLVKAGVPVFVYR